MAFAHCIININKISGIKTTYLWWSQSTGSWSIICLIWKVIACAVKLIEESRTAWGKWKDFSFCSRREYEGDQKSRGESQATIGHMERLIDQGVTVPVRAIIALLYPTLVSRVCCWLFSFAFTWMLEKYPMIYIYI